MSKIVRTVTITAEASESLTVADLRKFLARWDELADEQGEQAEIKVSTRLSLNQKARTWLLEAELP